MTMALDAKARVFTTIPFDGGDGLLDPAAHIERLTSHAERLGIVVPADLIERMADLLPAARESLVDQPNDRPSPLQPPALLRVELNRGGGIRLFSRRPRTIVDASEVRAIAHLAPRFAPDVLGTKHADWNPYDDARTRAREAGCEVALLVADGAIVDADRAAPLLLDSDGVAYCSRSDGGGVDSLTLVALSSAMEDYGIPLREALLTRRMVARAADLIVVGSGIGVARIVDIDGQPVGAQEPSALFKACANRQEERLATGWTRLQEVG